MGLLPIFLTLALFIFLWGLVNYNSFVTKRSNIEELSEAANQLTHQYQVYAGKLSEILTTSHAITPPSRLTLSPLDASGKTTDRDPHLVDLTHEWQLFVRQFSAPGDDVQVRQLVEALDETATEQRHALLRWRAAVRDYNNHRRRMPYRLIARLFGFQPISATA